MFFTNLRRIVSSGFVGFWRNAFVSLSSVLIMSVAIFVMGSLIFLGVMLRGTLENVQERVDINVYFTLEAEEDDILSLKDRLEDLDQVAVVTYTSPEEALDRFIATSSGEDGGEGDNLIAQGIEELGENPLPASLSILAEETSQYEEIANYLESDAALTASGEDIVEEINYFQNKEVIDRLAAIISTVERVGLYTMIFLFALAILITFNTVRLAIYTSREEISVMRLVGASDTYIRGPFVVAGVLGGLLAAAIVLMAFYPLTLWLGPKAAEFFGSQNLFDYYINNFLQMLLIFLGAGILLGAVSSFLAVRRYLRY